jgi:putative peptide zinc metalloprotease protein
MDYCSYPPSLADGAEITTRPEIETPSYIAGVPAIGRYLILGPRERSVLDLLDGTRTAQALCCELGGVGVAELASFLSKLDDTGILAGQRSIRFQLAMPSGSRYYLRWRLFHPEPLFGRMLRHLGWIWTPGFLAVSLASIGAACLLAILNWAELLRFANLAIRNQYFAILLAAWLVTACHEFSHGLTAKAFGGRATEVGFLLIYFCLPAFYCNVSGIHLIPQRGRRLWVIAAGIYSQLLMACAGLLLWSAFSPDTLASQTGMVFALASLLDLLFNANPLIKLDGYYFLSQWWNLPNLMGRSRACWRDLGRRWLMGMPARESSRFTVGERRRLLAFGFFWFFFNLALAVAIVWYASGRLMDWFAFPGLLLSAALMVAISARPLAKTARFWFGEGDNVASKPETVEGAARRWRRLVPGGIVVAILAALLLPWTASVGSYGTLLALPGRETIIRAPENASLLVLAVQPGQQVATGAVIARMGNLDVDEQIAAVRTDLARVAADEERLQGELRVQEEAARTSEWQLVERRREFSDLDAEEQQVRSRFRDSQAARAPVLSVSAQGDVPPKLPPALAVLESEADRVQAGLLEASQRRDRTRILTVEALAARSELDAIESRAASLASELAGARERLNAALIEHERRHASARTEVQVARTQLAASHAQISNLTRQLEAARRLGGSLGERLSLLERKRAQFSIESPRPGTLFDDELPRTLGQYFSKGAEICRVADVRELLVRMQVAEQELADIHLSQGVRVKSRTFPDRVFRGSVSNIGGQSELNENGQRTYRVELTIRNQDGLLRPGMTVFARADFGRHPLVWLLTHKLKQSLRPELWML